VNPIERQLETHAFLVSDGAMATELEAMGEDLGGPLWSARLLLTAPERIATVHRSYADAGADILTTASYQASMPALLAHGCTRDEAEALLVRSVELARHNAPPGVLVAASVGSYGAFLANGAEYRGDYGLAPSELERFHREHVAILAEVADLVAFETIPSLTEARVLRDLLDATPGACGWLSFSCRDPEHISDGTPWVECVRTLADSSAIAAIGVNCCDPAGVTASLEAARAWTPKPLIAYPNSGERWEGGWRGPPWAPERFCEAATSWIAAGASIVGGCCRTGPRHIEALRRMRMG